MWMGLLIAVASATAPDTGALAATPYFRTLSAADGLPSSEVRKLAEDRRGFLWIGTEDGLARYDGVGFRVWRHDPADPGSIAGNDVSALYVDREDRLWCGGEDAGLNLLDPRRQTFVHYRRDGDEAHRLGSNDIWAITEGADGAIFAGGYGGGVDRLDPASGTFRHWRHDPARADSLVSDNVLALIGDARGRIWIGTDAGIDVLEPDGRLRHVDLAALAVPGAPVNALALIADDDGVLAGTRLGVLRIDAALHASRLAASELPDPAVYALLRDEDGELWIGTRGGLARRGADGRIAAYREHAALPGGLPANAVFDALRDHEGGVWFALRDGGLVRLPPYWRNFALYRHDPADPLSLSANTVQGLDVDAAGRLWAVNRDGGIDRLDPETGRVERHAARWPVPDKGLQAVLDDGGGQLWVGHGRGVRVYDLQSGKFDDLPLDPRRPDALARGVRQLLRGDDDTVWALAVGGGMHRIDRRTHRIERFDEAAGTLRSVDLQQMARAPDGALYVASAAGVDRFDAAAGRFRALPGVPAQRVHALAFAADGTLWLHVLGALEHYRLRDGVAERLERLGAAEGWPAQTVGSIAVDDAGRLWIGSARGLWRVDPATRAIRVFDAGDGLASAEFSRFAFARRTDGSLFGATLGGIVGFQPARVTGELAPPPLVLDRVTVRRDGRELELDPAAAPLALRWNDRDLRLTARALSYANPVANRYRWLLAPLDADWVDTGNRGEREFAQLPAGAYRLRLRATNAGGTWSEPAAPLRLVLPPPPWATPPAYAAYATLALLAVWLALHGWRARLRRRHAFELAEQQRRFAEAASAAKSEFLATMGHEIRTPMTGVLGMTELLLRTPLDATQRGYAEAIRNSGRVLLRLVNDSLDLARIEAGKLELEDAPFDLHALLREVAALESPLAAAKGLAFDLRLAADAPRHVRGDAVRVQQVVLNLVNNAIKFTERGAVALELARGAGGAAELRVRDSGPGLSEAMQAQLFRRFAQGAGAPRRGGSGLGLAICRELVARMGGTIALDSQLGLGSTFRVTLPLPAIDADRAAEAATAPRPASSADAPRPARILLVEDDATVAAVIAGLLRAQGHEVRRVGDGLAALAETALAAFDAALIDLDLPGVDGLALARLLRDREARDGRPRLPLVGISARSVGDEEALCRAAGMDAFLRKPLDGETLAHCLRRILPEAFVGVGDSA
jgi:signal transduction histidine kinase/CheY-like chemotaxis protein/sugar lactone lactonase YvrE